MAGNYVYNTYKDSKENGYYLSSDKINDINILPIEDFEGKLTTVIACQNRSLRILDVNICIEVLIRENF